MKHLHLIPATLVLCVLVVSSHVYAASVSILPTGNPASFSVEGSGMEGVAGFQLDIAYDATSLTSPTVTQGALVSGAMLAANTSRPGIIKIAVISTKTFSNSGQIATVTFASQRGSGGITSATVSMINSTGAAVSASATVAGGFGSSTAELTSTPGVPFSQPTPSTVTTTQRQNDSPATPGTVTGTSQTYLGTVTLPTDQQQRADSQPAPSPPSPVYSGETAAVKTTEQTQPAGKPAAETKPEETPQYVAYKGILDRFKQYNGSKTLASMAALFDKKVAQSVSQKPAIQLSNGKDSVTLTVDIPARISSSPNFAVNGGTLVTFKQDKQVKGRWTVEVLPEADAVKVTVTLITGSDEFEYPLTVVAPAKTDLTLDARGWDRFITEVGTEAAPLHDLNSDGVRDYIDEFIFVANYLILKAAPVKPTTGRGLKK